MLEDNNVKHHRDKSEREMDTEAITNRLKVLKMHRDLCVQDGRLATPEHLHILQVILTKLTGQPVVKIYASFC